MSTESAKALRRIKALVTGERHPHWDTYWAVTNSRGLIADECDRALSEPAAPKAAKEALEAYAKPQRWLRAYQPTGELGLTRCVFTSAGHGFELAQEALAELEEES